MSVLTKTALLGAIKKNQIKIEPFNKLPGADSPRYSLRQLADQKVCFLACFHPRIKILGIQRATKIKTRSDQALLI